MPKIKYTDSVTVCGMTAKRGKLFDHETGKPLAFYSYDSPEYRWSFAADDNGKIYFISVFNLPPYQGSAGCYVQTPDIEYNVWKGGWVHYNTSYKPIFKIFMGILSSFTIER